jgi:hypothetical protein
MKSKYHTAQFTPPYGIQHRQRVERAAHLAYHTNADGPVVRCVGFKCVVGSSLAAARSRTILSVAWTLLCTPHSPPTFPRTPTPATG